MSPRHGRLTRVSPVPPFVLVAGPERLLAERAVAGVLAELREADPELETIRLAPAAYEPGELGLHSSPSLFGGSTAIVVEDVDEAGDDLLADLLAMVADPSPEVTVVVVHKSGMRGKKLLEALKKSGARVIDCPAVKSDRDKSDFVVHEFRRQGRTVTSPAVQALVEAVGKDLRELAAACSQLVADTDGAADPIDDRLVEVYHGGKVEASGFRVADAVIAGQTGEALRLLRHAIASGVDPVPIVAVLAAQLRTLVKVGAAGRGSSAQVAKTLGMAPWQVDKARRSIGHWDGPSLGAAIQAVASADVEVKGGGRDPVYAVERAILAVASARAGRRQGE
ncbi:MAG: DNA polymerase III subunit delta [Actinomycetales bacterium]|nr:MAG: DNA polymerase III subunit delta [Actinomycetales bacterium]